MPSMSQQNLETVMIDFFGALGRADFEAAAELLEPDVTWQGVREDLACHGREEVVDTFRWGIDERREIDPLEFIPRPRPGRRRSARPDVDRGGRRTARRADLQRLHAP